MAGLTENRNAGAKHDGVNIQADLVDQVRRKQRLRIGCPPGIAKAVPSQRRARAMQRAIRTIVTRARALPAGSLKLRG